MHLKEIYQHLDIENAKVRAKAKRVIKYLYNKYDFAGIGLYRVVFNTGNGYVIKFPLSAAGEYCNDGEGSWFHETYAKSRIVMVQGFTCVVQEEVVEASQQEIVERLGHYPDWVMSIDCGQVGKPS